MEEEKQNLKDVGLLLTIIYQLASVLGANFDKMEHILSWTEKICKENDIGMDQTGMRSSFSMT